ncbi:MAG: hypothetical protein JO199_09070 [Candidatus Eremiobacteraeota bacterium]|nr:hypothetical protein [Candidatus Eremiobacteraeota bacterium]
MTFNSLSEAVRLGFKIYDRTNDGYIVRARTERGWALAIVKLNAEARSA